jgi:5-methylcytosine-specific restriction endonuclease McrA
MTTNFSTPPRLAELDSALLTSRIAQLLGRERATLVEFLWHLAELERRNAHLALGHSSLFVYCVEQLHLSEGSAYRRTIAARLLVRFPVIGDYLADGRLNLTTLALLNDLLDFENGRDILNRAAGRSKRDVEHLLATLRPKPEVKDSIRKLPSKSATLSLTGGSAPAPAPTAAPLPAPAVGLPPHPRIEARNGERYAVHINVSREFRDELEQVKSALSHKVPGGSLEAVLRECFRVTLEACAKQKRGAQRTSPEKLRTAPSTSPEKSSRHIPADVRRNVCERDGNCCAYVSPDGKRCGSTWQLEFHHVNPFALGGRATMDNVSLRCRRHNQYEALLDFGAEHMSRFGLSRSVLTQPDEAPRRP